VLRDCRLDSPSWRCGSFEGCYGHSNKVEIPYMERIFLTSWETVSSTRRILHHKVCCLFFLTKHTLILKELTHYRNYEFLYDVTVNKVAVHVTFCFQQFSTTRRYFVGIKQNNIPDIMNFEAHFCQNFHLNFETKRDTELINGTRTVCSTLNYNIN
jgi:hypothetical protein